MWIYYIIHITNNKGDYKMRHNVMLFRDDKNFNYKVMKYSKKQHDYVVLFEGTRSECVTFMMKK